MQTGSNSSPAGGLPSLVETAAQISPAPVKSQHVDFGEVSVQSGVEQTLWAKKKKRARERETPLSALHPPYPLSTPLNSDRQSAGLVRLWRGLFIRLLLSGLGCTDDVSVFRALCQVKVSSAGLCMQISSKSCPTGGLWELCVEENTDTWCVFTSTYTQLSVWWREACLLSDCRLSISQGGPHPSQASVLMHDSYTSLNKHTYTHTHTHTSTRT